MAEALKFLIEVDSASGEQKVRQFSSTLGGVGTAANTAANSTTSAFDKIGTRLSSVGSQLTSVGATLSIALSAPILAIGGMGIAFNAMQEQAQISFTTLLGSADKAKTFLAGLRDFAATTPFEFPGLVAASQRLLAMGFAADQIMPTLKAVGDAAAALGASQESIDRVTLALGQMQGRGKVATQEMNQLTEVGIPAWAILADSIGVSEAKLRDMVEKGVVPADRAIKALTDGMTERFGGMMAQQATTFAGLMSTIKDESRFLAGELTEGLFNVLKPGLEIAVGLIKSVRAELEGMPDSAKAALGIGGLIVAAIGPAIFIVGTLAGSIGNIITLMQTMHLTSLASFGAMAGAAATVVGVLAAVAAGIAVAIDGLNRIEANPQGPQSFGDAVSMGLTLGLGPVVGAMALGKSVKGQFGAGEAPPILGGPGGVSALAEAAFQAGNPALRTAGGANDPWKLLGGGKAGKTPKDTTTVDSISDNFVKQVIKETNEAAALEVGLMKLETRKASTAAITDKLGNAIRDAAKEAELAGVPLPPLTQKYYDLMLQQEANIKIDEENMRSLDRLTDIRIKNLQMFAAAEKEFGPTSVGVSEEASARGMEAAIANMGGQKAIDARKNIADMRLEVARTSEAVASFAKDHTASQVWDQFGADIQENAEFVKIYGGSLSQTEVDLLRFTEASEKAQARTNQLKNEWGDAAGGFVTDASHLVIDALFERGGKLKKSQGELNRLAKEFGEDQRGINETVLQYYERIKEASKGSEEFDAAFKNLDGGFQFFDKLKSMAAETSKDMLKSLTDGFLSPFTDKMKDLGKEAGEWVAGALFGGPKKPGEEKGGEGLFSGLSGMFGGLFGGGGGGGLSGGITLPDGTVLMQPTGGGGIGGMFGGGASQAMSGLMSAMNPINAGLSIANGAVDLFNKTFGMIGKGKGAAEQIVKMENAFTASAIDVLNDPELSGTNKSKLFENLVSTLETSGATFAATDPNNQKVFNQMIANLMPFITTTRKDLAPWVDKEAAATAADSPEGIFSSAVDRFADTVSKFTTGSVVPVQAIQEAVPVLAQAVETAAAATEQIAQAQLSGDALGNIRTVADAEAERAATLSTKASGWVTATEAVVGDALGRVMTVAVADAERAATLAAETAGWATATEAELHPWLVQSRLANQPQAPVSEPDYNTSGVIGDILGRVKTVDEYLTEQAALSAAQPIYNMAGVIGDVLGRVAPTSEYLSEREQQAQQTTHIDAVAFSHGDIIINAPPEANPEEIADAVLSRMEHNLDNAATRLTRLVKSSWKGVGLEVDLSEGPA